jgi:type VI secretion system secreted protein VgrG
MKPRSGKAGKPVDPAAPAPSEEAASSRQRESEAGEAGGAGGAGESASRNAEPHKPPTTEEEEQEKSAWIEIEMVDEADEPVPGVVYRITLPDGTVADGTLDEKGSAKVVGIVPGTCQVSFPDLDQEAWEKI